MIFLSISAFFGVLAAASGVSGGRWREPYMLGVSFCETTTGGGFVAWLWAPGGQGRVCWRLPIGGGAIILRRECARWGVQRRQK